MATLQQTLRGLPQANDQLTRGPGGVLQRGSTLQQATQQAGLAAAPTTPMAAQMTGASAQAAKMAGTPQQMQAALQQSTEAVTLGTALRRKQYGREATAEELGAMSKSADMQKLGGLGDRVTKMISTEYGKLSAAQAQLTPTAEYSGKDLAPIFPELEIIKTNPTSPEAMSAMVRVNTYLGKDPNSVLSATEFNKLYQDAQTAITSVAKTTIRDVESIPIAEVVSDLGYDLPTLSALLEVPELDLQKYTVKQLQDRINQVATEEFAQTQRLQEQAVSPLVGVAERGLAREAARELSAVGVRATEADIQRLTGELSRADQVTFMGQTRAYADWLADDEVSAMIKEVVDSPADSQLRKDVKSQAPDFYNFITRNEAALKQAASQIETGTSKFKQIQDTNKKTLQDLGFTEDLISTIAPELTGLKSEIVDVNKVPVLGYLASVPKDARPAVASELESAIMNKTITPEELNSVTIEDLQKLGIGKVDSNWDRFKIKEANRADFNKAGSPAEQLKYITDSTIPDLNSLMSSSSRRAVLGLPGVNISALDLNKDGKPDLDNLSEVYNQINPDITLKDATKGVVVPTKKTFALPELNAVDQSLLSKLQPGVSKGAVSLQDLLNTPLTTEEAVRLNSLRIQSGAKVDPEIQKIAQGKQNTAARIKNEVLGVPVGSGRGVPRISETAMRFQFLSSATGGAGNNYEWKAPSIYEDQELLRNTASNWINEQSDRGANISQLFRSYVRLADNNLLTPEIDEKLKSKFRATSYPVDNPKEYYRYY